MTGINFSEATLQQIEQQQVHIYPVAACAVAKEKSQQQLILCYENVTVAENKIWIERLKKALIASNLKR